MTADNGKKQVLFKLRSDIARLSDCINVWDFIIPPYIVNAFPILKTSINVWYYWNDTPSQSIGELNDRLALFLTHYRVMNLLYMFKVITLIAWKDELDRDRSMWASISAFSANFEPDVRCAGSTYNFHIGDCVV